MNRMLISAAQANEVRVALAKDQTLYDLDIEYLGFEQKKANIYKGKVSRIEPSLEAAFVEYGAERHGFLPYKEVARSYFKSETQKEPFAKLGIKDALYEGQEVLVQIDKEEHANKGAALTTFISLAGSYLVLMPNNPRVGGVSRRIEGKERDDLRDLISNLNLPEGMGLIVRTAGVGKSQADLKWDLESLLHRWQTIEASSIEHRTPFLIHQEGDAVMRAIRDYLRPDIVEILVDTRELFEKTKSYIEQVKPDLIDKIKFYQHKTPLFSYYQIEKQIETAYQRVVRLPSGGSISIDHTEALVSIDVNSARATKGSDIEETALNTNLEAAEEIARQLRLRDIGGLIVIDFIDMSHIKNQREVGGRLKEALAHDRARVQIGHITRFGLLEMSRQRLRQCLGATVQTPCPRCEGRGTIRNIESLATSMIRILEEETIKENTAEIQAHFSIELATFMLNERRSAINEIALRQNVNIIILPNQYLETPHYHIKHLRINEILRNKEASYNLPIAYLLKNFDKKSNFVTNEDKPQITPAASQTACPATTSKLTLGSSIKKFFRNLFSNNTPDKVCAVEPQVKITPPATSSAINQSRRDGKRSYSRGNNKYRRTHYDRNRRPKSATKGRIHSSKNIKTPSSTAEKEHNDIIVPSSDLYPETYAERVSTTAARVSTTNDTKTDDQTS